MVLTCPPRDCRHREGPWLLDERVYRGREAELQARVDRARVRIVHVSARDRARALDALRAFRSEIAALGPAAGGDGLPVDLQCEPALVERTS